jgi:hypothetical protein
MSLYNDGVRFSSLVTAAAALAFLGAGSGDAGGQLQSTALSYYSNLAVIARITGRDTTMDYYQRLLDDSDLLKAPSPDGYPPALWQHSIQSTARLDLSLAMQLLHQAYQPMASIRGLGETLIRASKDGTMQPLAVYVPSGYVPGHQAPLIVFLHGVRGGEGRPMFSARGATWRTAWFAHRRP